MTATRVLTVLVCCFLAAAGLSHAASAEHPAFWRDVPEQAAPQAEGHRVIHPTQARYLMIQRGVLENQLAQAPTEGAQDRLLLSLPMPDGTTEWFRVEHAPIMEAELAARFPEIRTYRGQGVDDPTATLRCDLTPAGFHAQVLRAEGAVYIDPVFQGEDLLHQSYFKRDLLLEPEEEPFVCHVQDAEGDHEHHDTDLPPLSAPNAPSGSTLRTYRLALAGTGEYTTKVCQPNPPGVACGLAAMVTSMNRVNGVYEREVAILMVLVANNDLLVYTDPAKDPYTNNNGSAMLGENQATIDAVIGSANYDIGHVFSTGGGGVAYVGVPCRSGWKAQGVTGRANPVGDPFDIDYVAHEMGHQWGAHHTFNGTTSSCAGNRSATSAYEPGSGSTIMAYAGICGTEDLQPNSDPYFHSRSFDQIITYSTTGSGDPCAQKTPTGNSAPSVNAGPSYTIPMQTPFALTGSATDPQGDPLTFNWEEYDLGTASPPQGDAAAARPIFRSFNATTSPTRVFPKLSDVLAGTQTFGEWMSQRTRTMTFRLTARDNRAGGGGVNYASTTVSVTATAGPFSVTQPASGTTWSGGASATVTWNVASTNLSPVNCSTVDILLSTDGGLTFPITLVAETPNDGTQAITVPALATSQARVKVACRNNVFFAISRPNFSITCTAPTSFSLTSPANGGSFSGNLFTLQWGASTGAAEYEVYLGTATDPPLFQTTAATSLTTPLPPGQTYHWRVVARNGCGQQPAPTAGTWSFEALPPVLEAVGPIDVDGSSSPGTSSNLNGVLEPGEIVLVATRWRNAGTSSVLLGATFGDFSGPAGATYSLVDPSANFGVLAPGETTTCLAGSADCYLISVSDPPSRPTPHWDSSVIETLSTGESRTLTLHVGRSFLDLAPDDPGQRFVETVFHNGITAGCGPALYCPGDPVTRWQMAVFLSQSIVGPGGSVPVSGVAHDQPYDCQAGGSSLFLDVAPEDPGCRFVHFLYQRGVTAGCGPSLYCPASTVTRWQMAVFIAASMHGPGNPIPVDGEIGGSPYSCQEGGHSLFSDVPPTDGGCPSVHFIFSQGVTAGCDSGLYCPGEPNTRWQMAVFLTTAFGLLLY